jgi:uncharacterized membrane protein YfcA
MFALIIITVLVATFAGSISGIGGGVLIKPVMDALCDMTSSQISFLSGTTVLGMTAVSLLKSRKGTIKIDRRGTMMALGAAFGGLFGKMLFNKATSSFPSSKVSLVQNIIMVVLTVTVFIYTLKKEHIQKKQMTNPVFSIFCGVFLGLMSSFLGIGGGPINIMILSYFFSMDSKTAALNSLYIIFFSQAVNLVSNAISGSIPEIDVVQLLAMIATGIVGAMVGRSLSKKMSDKNVDTLFMILMVVIIGISIYNCFHFAMM